ncbi:MAG: hypothetical protein ACHQ02_08995, partial [Candidatus Limnocylindrales bacterium]
SAPVIVEGRSMTAAMLAFVLAIIATIAFAHIVEAISMARTRRATPEPGTTWDLPESAGDGGAPQDEADGRLPEEHGEHEDEAVTAVDGRPGVHRGDPLVVGSSRSSHPS